MREVKRVHSQKGSTKWPPDKRKILKESEKYELKEQWATVLHSQDWHSKKDQYPAAPKGGVKRMLSHAVWGQWGGTVFWEAIGERLLILKMQVPFYPSIPLLDSTMYNPAPVQTLKDMYWKISHVRKNKMEVRLLSMKKCNK